MSRVLKRSLKLSGKVLLGMGVFLLLYGLATYACSLITIEREKDAKEEIAIYIKTNGVHTDIVVPVRSEQMDWTKEVKYAFTALKDTSCSYLALGWGDRGFYLETPEWKDLKFSVAFKAAFGLSSTAMHCTFYKQLPENSSCRKINISKEQYARLVSHVVNSFQRDKDGHFVHIDTKANYGITDAFYEAKGRYSLFYTCNTWANSALKTCGQRSCLWTILDKGIFAKYE
jgi:uncharacterized protein (TIGR02117 family)